MLIERHQTGWLLAIAQDDSLLLGWRQGKVAVGFKKAVRENDTVGCDPRKFYLI